MPLISVVSPVYLAEKSVNLLIDRIVLSVSKITQDYEIILVDDGSPDSSWEMIEKAFLLNNKIKGIKLSRNFGQHPAIMAGLSVAKGEWIVVMDCDLQDQPEEIGKLYNTALTGFDIVQARRDNRKDGVFKKLFSYLFSKVFSFMSGVPYNNEIANYGIYHKCVIEEVIKMGDYIKSFPLFIQWVGFSRTSVSVEHAPRLEGESNYSISRLISLAANTIISFSNKPLKIFIKIGLFISLISFIFGVCILYKYMHGDVTVIGYSSTIISIWFLSGIIISTIGVSGIYIGKIFDQTKGRPSYIIGKTTIK